MLADGKESAKKVRIALRKRVSQLEKKGIKVKLAVILAGDDPSSQIYVRNKEKACEKVGIDSVTYRLEKDVTQKDLIFLIDRLNKDESVHGILLQLPVYRHLDPTEAIVKISPEKDVDGFTPINTGKMYIGMKSFIPCTPKGCIHLLHEAGIPLEGKHAVVIGRSNIVGKPLAYLLTKENCTVTVCHSRTKDISAYTKNADILAVAIGKPGFITADMIKEGAVILDVGINRLEDGSICGDVKTDECAEKASWITPVPGGVGPMTIAMLLENTVEAAENYGMDA